jgi:predicted phosphoribosyltransferase
MKSSATDGRFRDRTDAGQQLAEQLAVSPPDPGTVVLALPRGGVPIGLEIAGRLGLPLEPLVVRKLGVPDFPEFAMGAIAVNGERVIDQELVRRLHLSDAAVEQVVQREHAELMRRARRYQISVPLGSLQGRSLIIVDDGMATGSTMLAAIAALRRAQVGSITVAVPVLAHEALAKVTRQVSRVLWLICPPKFESVGQAYLDFRQLGDDEVIAQLSRAQRLRSSDVSAGATSSH